MTRISGYLTIAYMNGEAGNIKPISSGGTIDQIVATLHSLIFDSQLKPGMYLPPERELAAQLGVSRFSLREALRVAQTQGLIIIERGKRPQVAEPSTQKASELMAITLRRNKKALLDLIEARRILEERIVRLAVKNINKSQLTELHELVVRMKNNMDDFDISVNLDVEFHNLLVKASGNIVFEIMMGSVFDLLKESRKKSIQLVGMDKTLKGHEDIYYALERRDEDCASEAMADHLDATERGFQNMELG